MADDAERIVVGRESVCVNCKHGKNMTVRTQMHPVNVIQEKRTNPAFEEPPPVYYIKSHCAHPVLMGQYQAAREVGVVVECDLFQSREIMTAEGRPHGS